MGKLIRALAYMDDACKGGIDTAVQAVILSVLCALLVFTGFVAIDTISFDGALCEVGFARVAFWFSIVLGFTMGAMSYYFPRD